MPLPSSSQTAGPPRIRRLAWLVRLLSLAGVLTLLVLPPMFWSDAAWVTRVAGSEWGLGLMQLDAGARLGGFLASLVSAGVAIWALWEIWALFGCYARGELLALRPVRHLRRMGLALVALAFAMPISHTLHVLALTLGNPAGQRQISFGLSSQHYLSLLFGLVLLALATVMREAVRLADENAEFV